MESTQQLAGAVGLALGASVVAARVVGRVPRWGVARLLDALVPAVLRRVDIDAVVRAGLERVDLAGIIRESTGSIAGDVVRGARMRGIAADEAVGRVRSRLLGRPS